MSGVYVRLYSSDLFCNHSFHQYSWFYTSTRRTKIVFQTNRLTVTVHPKNEAPCEEKKNASYFGMKLNYDKRHQTKDHKANSIFTNFNLFSKCCVITSVRLQTSYYT